MQPCRIAADTIACQRGERLLFRGLSFTLEAGEALQVAGANGLGKSSLLRILAGLLTPLAGSVTRKGQVALLDERPALDPHLPLGRALAFWAGLDASDGESALAAMNLAGLAEVPVRHLSTGQRKRAAMARLIGQGADLWLLDEPYSGLDEVSRGGIDAMIRQALGQGCACIIVSHQPIALPGLSLLNLADYAP